MAESGLTQRPAEPPIAGSNPALGLITNPQNPMLGFMLCFTLLRSTDGSSPRCSAVMYVIPDPRPLTVQPGVATGSPQRSIRETAATPRVSTSRWDAIQPDITYTEKGCDHRYCLDPTSPYDGVLFRRRLQWWFSLTHGPEWPRFDHLSSGDPPTHDISDPMRRTKGLGRGHLYTGRSTTASRIR